MNEAKKEERLFSGVMRFNAKILGLVLGLLTGLILFIATNWLVIMGGHTTYGGEIVVGPHLSLLGQFLIGYKVSFLGSFIGFAYGFALGSLAGTSISWIYNLFVYFRN